MWLEIMEPAQDSAGKVLQLQRVADAVRKNVNTPSVHSELFVVEIENGYYSDVLRLRECGIEVTQVGKP